MLTYLAWKISIVLFVLMTHDNAPPRPTFACIFSHKKTIKLVTTIAYIVNDLRT